MLKKKSTPELFLIIWPIYIVFKCQLGKNKSHLPHSENLLINNSKRKCENESVSIEDKL
jgi:hypothetical protein